MSSAFMDMDMEINMEENPFEDGGMPEGSSKKEENGFLDGFTDSAVFEDNPFDSDREEPDASPFTAQEDAVSDGAWEGTEEGACSETDGTEEPIEPEEDAEPEKKREENSDAEEESEDKKRAEHEAAEARRKAEWEARCETAF